MTIAKIALTLGLAGIVTMGAVNAYAKTTYFNADGALVMSSPRHKPKVYQLVNVSKQTINLDVLNKSSGVAAGYASTLAPTQAAAFIYNGAAPPLVWNCQIPAVAPAASQKVACNSVLKVTNYPTKTLDLTVDNGNYWLLENTPSQDLKQALQAAFVRHKLVK